MSIHEIEVFEVGGWWAIKINGVLVSGEMKPEARIKQRFTAVEEGALLNALGLTWQPIDHSQSESGQASFDGEVHLFKTDDGVVTGKYIKPGSPGIRKPYGSEVGVIGDRRFVPECSFWLEDSSRLTIDPDYWMPVPEFMKG